MVAILCPERGVVFVPERGGVGNAKCGTTRTQNGRVLVPNKWPRFCVQKVVAIVCPERGVVFVSKKWSRVGGQDQDYSVKILGEAHAGTQKPDQFLDTKTRPLSGHKNVAICWAHNRGHFWTQNIVHFRFGWCRILRSVAATLR